MTSEKNQKQEAKGEEEQKQDNQPKRQIVVEFDKQSIKIVKAEVSSNWELESILRKLLSQLNI